jgi:ATP-binding protein involved in chromosome partitioning
MSKLKSKINREDVLSVLRRVIDEETGVNVVDAGMVSSIVVRGDSIGFALEVDINKAKEKESLRKKCESVVKNISGVGKVTVVMTSSDKKMMLAKNINSEDDKIKDRQADLPAARKINNITNIILVASGKGGVGKSTVAVNLARSLSNLGLAVGIVDADIYGPSVPKMLGLKGKPEVDVNNRIIPKESENIKSVSIGYLIEEDSALIWRSSMALKAMNQLMLGVNWGRLDYLIVDTPPGTGDIQLSLCKSYDITGVVMVSTPQEVALLDVKKAAAMFVKIGVPILGIIENMSYFEDDRGKKNYIFGESVVKDFAAKSNIMFLGEIPILQDIRKACDDGEKVELPGFLEKITFKFKKQVEKLNEPL